MSRLETAIAYVIPQSEQRPHCHAPNGGMCRDCKRWGIEGEKHPNLRTCRIFREGRDSNFSCILFARARDSAI